MVRIENSGSIVKSVLSVPIATKSHEGVYKCVGENGVMNLLGTPEEIESVVTVQGMFELSICLSFKYLNGLKLAVKRLSNLL